MRESFPVPEITYIRENNWALIQYSDKLILAMILNDSLYPVVTVQDEQDAEKWIKRWDDWKAKIRGGLDD